MNTHAAPLWQTVALAVGVWAPSVAWAGVRASGGRTDEEGVRHSAERAFDGQLLTAWAEGAVGKASPCHFTLPA